MFPSLICNPYIPSDPNLPYTQPGINRSVRGSIPDFLPPNKRLSAAKPTDIKYQGPIIDIKKK
jgi:hypothetical protein